MAGNLLIRCLHVLVLLLSILGQHVVLGFQPKLLKEYPELFFAWGFTTVVAILVMIFYFTVIVCTCYMLYKGHRSPSSQIGVQAL